MKLRLVMLDDHSAFIRDAVNEKWIREHDPTIIEARIKEYKKAIRDLEQGQTKAKDQPTETQILEKWHNLYKSSHLEDTDEHLVHNWIRSKVLPELQKAGYKIYDTHKVLELFAGMDK